MGEDIQKTPEKVETPSAAESAPVVSTEPVPAEVLPAAQVFSSPLALAGERVFYLNDFPIFS